MNLTHRALSRAFSFCSGAPSFDLLQFLHRAAFELHHATQSDVAALALVMKQSDGSCLVGRSRDCQTLPSETLLGLLVEVMGEKLACRVKDHALDSVRFIDHRYRTSIVVRIDVPPTVSSGAECVVWFGLQGGAPPEIIAEAEEMGRALSEWLIWYGAVMQESIRIATERAAEHRRIGELSLLIHDARAPLGVLKYLIQAEGGERELTAVERELEYLERLLSQGGPRKVQNDAACCDVGEVVARVYRRYAQERGGDSLQFDRGYVPAYARVSDLDIERVVTNVVGNAQRHAMGSRTLLSIESRGDSVCISVRDNGPGISRDILDAIECERTLSPHATSGWGIGLRGCIAKVKECGGDLTIASRDGVGTKVTIMLPAASPPASRQALHVADGGVQRVSLLNAIDVFVVDNDIEHANSFARLLRSQDFSVRAFQSIHEFFSAFSGCDDVIILCDAHMPDGGAERLLSILSARQQSPRFAVVSGDATDEYLYKLAALGAQAFFTKPVAVDDVVRWIRSSRREGSPDSAHSGA